MGTKEKVYCWKCRHLFTNMHGDYECNAVANRKPRAGTETWYAKYADTWVTDRHPKEINKKNTCSWYEEIIEWRNNANK